MANSGDFRFHGRVQPIFFVTGTDTGVGKTLLTALLAQHLRRRQVDVAAFKPICSGSRADAKALHQALDGTLTLNEVNPWHFRAPIAPLLAARREKKSLKLGAVVSHIRSLGHGHEVVLVEGAGGLMSPMGVGFGSLELIVALWASPIIVASNRLGVVNHLLLTLKVLPEPIRKHARIVLMSPSKADAATADNAKLLGEYIPAKRIFELPWLGKKVEVEKVLKRQVVRDVLNDLYWKT